MITASVIADSQNPLNSRLTTFRLTYPRFIHSEFMTHRCFSRNAASSRAIPIEKMIEAVAGNPAWPESWGSNKPGMQAGEVLRPEIVDDIKHVLSHLAKAAIDTVNLASDIGLHKQVANRYLEPWGHITVIATATRPGLENFFGLRAHKDAQPEFQVLAFRMLNAYLNSVPDSLDWGQWHVPYQEDGETRNHSPFHSPTLQRAVGRIARVSFLRDDSDDLEKNIAIFRKCEEGGHWSPFEHVAMAVSKHPISNFDVGLEDYGISGWHQLRKFYDEERRSCDLIAAMESKPDWITL